jgi:hypothetical protein
VCQFGSPYLRTGRSYIAAKLDPVIAVTVRCNGRHNHKREKLRTAQLGVRIYEVFESRFVEDDQRRALNLQ